MSGELPLNDPVTEETVKRVRESLPNADAIRERLLSLEFTALCPDGREIPVQHICEEYAHNPRGLTYRTFEDRLVLVIRASFPGLAIPYWQQAFYCSTGMNSGMPNTWLPFDGIVMQGLYSQFKHTAPPPNWMQKEQKAEPKETATLNFNFLPNAPEEPQQKTFLGKSWFSKNPFYNWSTPTSKSFGSFAPVVLTPRMQINGLLHDAYGELFLPEGNYLRAGYGFSRFGTLSYALASHALGGLLFTGDAGAKMMPPIDKDAVDAQIKRVLGTPSPPQACFARMSSTYPITTPNIVNRYIEEKKGFSYFNAFRQEGIYPPGLSFLNVPIISLGYSLPLEDYENQLGIVIHQLWWDFKAGLRTIDELRSIFANPRQFLLPLLREIRERTVLPNQPEALFDIMPEQLARSRPGARYYGGKSRRHKKKKGRRSTKKA